MEQPWNVFRRKIQFCFQSFLLDNILDGVFSNSYLLGNYELGSRSLFKMVSCGGI